MPSIQELLYICEYLDVTPSDFFNDKVKNPALVNKAYEVLCNMDEDDILALLTIMNKLNSKK